MRTSGPFLLVLALALTGCTSGTPGAVETVTVEVPASPAAVAPATTESEPETPEATETEAEESNDGGVFADNADYDAHRSDLLSVLVPIWGESTANDLVNGEDSLFSDEGLRQMCVIWQSGVTVSSEEESDENMKQVYLSSGANDARAAALVDSLKENVCSR